MTTHFKISNSKTDPLAIGVNRLGLGKRTRKDTSHQCPASATFLFDGIMATDGYAQWTGEGRNL